MSISGKHESYSSYTQYNEDREERWSRGKRQPLETIDKRKLLDEGRILNLAAHDPQTWSTVLDNWASMVSMEVTKLLGNFTAEEMYSYLENFLGETARAIWESYKLNCPTDFQQDLSLGVNPYDG